MKPLELNIYEKHPDTDAYRVGGFYSPYCLVSEDKRFSEAELAAEWWKQAASVSTVEATGGTPTTTLAKLEAIERACTLPHYDEADQ